MGGLGAEAAHEHEQGWQPGTEPEESEGDAEAGEIAEVRSQRLHYERHKDPGQRRDGVAEREALASALWGHLEVGGRVSSGGAPKQAIGRSTRGRDGKTVPWRERGGEQHRRRAERARGLEGAPDSSARDPPTDESVGRWRDHSHHDEVGGVRERDGEAGGEGRRVRVLEK